MIGAIKGYVTLRPNGLFSISYLPPVIARVGRTTALDAYIAPGDGFGQHRVPRSAVDLVFSPLAWRELEPTRCKFVAEGARIYLSKRGENWGNQYMITAQPPVVRGDDCYPDPGDRLFCGVFCEWFAVALWGKAVPKTATTWVPVGMRGQVLH